MRMSIFDFISDIEQIADSMAAEAEITGEISDELKEELQALNLDESEKIEQLCLKYKERQYLAAAKKAEAKKLSEDAAIMEKANERLQDYICFLTAGKNWESAKAKVTYRTAPPSVKITDESKIPAQFWKASAPTISKEEIKKAIKAGESVPGAYLESGKRSGRIS